jgi:hypothetical protein
MGDNILPGTASESGYQRRKCSNCDEDLSFSESDPCEACQPFVDVVEGLLIPKNQAQSLYDFYKDGDGEELGREGHDIVPRQSHERVKS